MTTLWSVMTWWLIRCRAGSLASPLSAIQPKTMRDLWLSSTVVEEGEGCAHKRREGEGGIAPNQVIARSEFEVHREIYTE